MPQFFLAKTEYYAFFPIFKLSPPLALGDTNIAAQLLFSSVSRADLERLIAQAFAHAQFDTHGSSRREQEDARVETASARLDSSEFGQIDLRLTIFSLPATDALELLDRTVYAEITKIGNIDGFFAKLRVTLQQHLIWETYAISYDLILPELDFYNEVLRRHITTLSAEAIYRVIDIGAGTGSVTVPLLRTGRSVTAVDISRAMLDRMRTRLSAPDTAKVTIVQQDAKDLSAFADKSFDGVSVLLAFFDMSDPAAALAEAIRVLRPGGIFVATEPKRSFKLADLLHYAEIGLKHKDSYNKMRSHWERVCTVNKQINPSQRPARLYIEDIKDVLDKTKFNVIRMEDSHHGNCATVWARKTY